MLDLPKQLTPPVPPFVLPRELQYIIAKPGFLKYATAQRARELYQESAFNFDLFRDLSTLGTYCALGYYEGVEKLEKCFKVQTILELGADPNAKDRYANTPMHGAIMNGQAEAVGMLLKYGADPSIADAEGCTPNGMIPMATAAVHAACQKYKRQQEGINASLEEKTICAACGKPGSKSQCARCRVFRYCDRECQIAHWKGGHKAACVPFNNKDVSIVVTPTYRMGGNLFTSTMSLDAIKNRMSGIQGGEAYRNGSQKPAPIAHKDSGFKPSMIGNFIIIKAQVPAVAPGSTSASGPRRYFGPIMVYNKSRDFTCHISPEGQSDEYERLEDMIRKMGPLGLKGYFVAELQAEDSLKIKVGDMLAEQPW